MKASRIRILPESLIPVVRQRLAAKSKPTILGCVEWTGPRDRYGYGSFSVVVDGRRRYTGSHRVSWLAFKGDIPGELVIDHLCRNRLCINVDHMDLVTSLENVQRGDRVGRGRSRPDGRPSYSCGQHGRGDGSVRVRKDGYRYWACRICNRRRLREWRERQKKTT